MAARGIAVLTSALLFTAIVATISPARAAAVDSPLRADPPTQRLIVKFRDDASAPLRTLAVRDRLALVAAGANIGLTPVRSMALGAQVVALEHAVPLSEARAIAARLAANTDVEYVEPERRMRPLFVPNDPLLSKQGYLGNIATGISAYGAWDITTGNSGTVVAVVDTGYRPHADLAGRILPGYDFIADVDVANDGNGRDPDASDPGDWINQADLDGAFKDSGCDIESSSWHGTATMSIIAANTNNGASMAGVNWSASISPLRVLGKCGGTTSDIADAISWAGGLSVPGVPANPSPAQIINLSLGGDGTCGFAEQAAISAVLAKGITRAVVVAAGNDSGNVANSDPANCAGVIAVAATNTAGNLAAYSNFGAGVTISAPGGDPKTIPNDWIVVLGNTGTTVPLADAAFLEAGTSAAAPLVSGVISLMLAVSPNLTGAQIKSALAGSAKPFPSGSTCSTANCGAGIVNALGAVQAAAGNTIGANYEGLWWAAPAGSESGWGINFAHQGDVIFATWFTYDVSGNAWWLTMTANKVSDGVYFGTLFKNNGPPFNVIPFDSNQVTATAVGSGTLTFTAANAGTFAYTVNGISQTKAITPQVFGPLPTCVWGAQTDLTQATNYQDLWWASPAGSESGWGVNLTQQGTTIFATWFTYDVNRNPVWYSATLLPAGRGGFSGPLFRNTGPAFSAVPFSPAQVHGVSVGSATFTFTNGNNGTFAYQVNDGINIATQSKAITRQVFRAPGTVCQ